MQSGKKRQRDFDMYTPLNDTMKWWIFRFGCRCRRLSVFQLAGRWFIKALPVRKGIAFFAALLLLLASSPVHAQLNDICRRDAKRYDRLLALKQTTTPERIAEVYVEAFTTKGADRNAQAVWRRLKLKEDGTLEPAIEAHVRRYYSKRSPDERDALKKEITEQVHDMHTIYELVLAFEKAAITTKLAAEVMAESWRALKRWNAPNPIEHYVGMIKLKGDAYINAGFRPEQAAVRAVVETRAAVDRDRGVPASAIIDKGNICYKDSLNKTEFWLRKKTLGPLTEAEAKELSEKTQYKPGQVSRLTYYTHIKFGPRDYSLDRFKAIQIAAENPAE
jgi:hypothetical protein